MRIAVCLSGIPNHLDYCLPTIAAAFQGLEVDWFYSTWATPPNWEALSPEKRLPMQFKAFEFVSEPTFLAQERRIIERNIGGHPDFFILPQWYTVGRVLALRSEWAARNGVAHDIVVRCRFDLELKFDFSSALPAVTPNSVSLCEAETRGYDQFIFGPPEVMDQLQELVHWLPGFNEQYGDQWGFRASPLVEAFFRSKSVSVRKADLPFRVHRTVKNARLLREARTRLQIKQNHPEFSDKVWVEGTNRGSAPQPAPWNEAFWPNSHLLPNETGGRVNDPA